MIETNASEVAANLQARFEDFEQEVEEEIDRAVLEAQRLAKQRVPVQTGALRDDISVDLEEDKVFNTLDYAVYQDQGTIYIEATHYLTDSARDAFEASLQRLRS
ncbi:urease accessory protein UreE [Salinibacter ruber]|mgnify:CR=1 FL=1|uniref:HK97 gp10 family phage protein n=1 Tax=Salinibacter ruber TaxID=146919 RepID=UPI00216A5226|nr:HK97 gp10 family phage protein [Salinibacter ruber]MCS4139596.1 urease accessory protein UreE [Salinibacter ruber]